MLIGNSNLNHRNQFSIKFFAENNIRFGIYSNANASNIDINCIAFTNRYHGIIAGSNMSTGGGYAMLVDDESGYFSTRFWYDRLGRLVLSQNTKQFNLTPQRYSYTRYDNLGRIFEVGEKKENASGSQWLFPDIFGSTINGMPNKRTIDQAKLNSWLDLNATTTRIQVTSTYYSDPISGMTFVQDHLRNRVAAVTYEDQFDGDPETYASATHYSYDIHGNVKSLYQQNNDILATGQQIKRIDYEYDLISGNVNKVIYQPNQTDQFIHSYQYDADNRLKEVLTSKDGYVWDSDARYFYYAHGPLARVELGDLNVQGLDYAYTLQGWIKGVNSNLLNPQHDMGLDGYDQAGNPNSLFGWDAMGYTLGYFDDDYSPIGPATNGGNIVTPEFEASLGTSNLHTSRRNLYNGNISHWVTTLPQVTGGAVTPITNTTSSFPVDPMGMAFEYDQLNRLLESEGYDNINTATNSWNTTSGYSPLYKNTFTYDANGNIMTQKRFDRTSATPFDSLTYHYEEDLGHKVNNKLRRVTDIAGSVSGIDDIEDQSNPDNYLYDEIGNLITDDQEGIATIEWTVSGKVSKITREAGSTAPDLEFHYDPMGNRITKIVKPAGQLANPDQWLYTYYTRDAQGNPMAVYSEFSELDPSTQLPVMRFDLTERYIYGSTRIATDTTIVRMEQAAPTGTHHFRRKLGTKHFELTNHLGNVLAVVTDKKIPVDLGTPDGITDGYLPDIASVSDYYPFGMVIPGRNFQGYRFGLNGKEQVNEINGDGNAYDYGFRVYDPRLGRPIKVDPISHSYPHLSPYQFYSNNPILNIDLDGLEGVDYTRNTILFASGVPMFKTEDAGNISRYSVYAFNINSTIHILHNGKHISFNPSSAPTQLGLAFNPGYYFALNIKEFSDRMLKGNSTKRDLISKVSAATGYKDGDISKPIANGFVNTFRHFAWQSTIAMALGEGTAKRVGDYHEADGIFSDQQHGKIAKDNIIDLLNNEYAREYARDFNFNDVMKSAESYANYLNGLAQHITSTIDGYSHDSAFDGIRSGEIKLFDPCDNDFLKLYESAKDLDIIHAE